MPNDAFNWIVAVGAGTICALAVLFGSLFFKQPAITDIVRTHADFTASGFVLKTWRDRSRRAMVSAIADFWYWLTTNTPISLIVLGLLYVICAGSYSFVSGDKIVDSAIYFAHELLDLGSFDVPILLGLAGDKALASAPERLIVWSYRFAAGVVFLDLLPFIFSGLSLTVFGLLFPVRVIKCAKVVVYYKHFDRFALWLHQVMIILSPQTKITKFKMFEKDDR